VSVTLLDPSETDGKGDTRTFSLTSIPEDDHLEIAMRLRDTAFKRALRRAAPGAPLRLRGPAGRFTLEAAEGRPALLLAGGIGVTPFVSMLRSLEAHPHPAPVTLLASARRHEDVPFLRELLAIADRVPSVRVVPVLTGDAPERWTGERGRIDAAMLARHRRGMAAPVHFLAGPSAMVEGLEAMLEAAGVKPADIRTDTFFGY